MSGKMIINGLVGVTAVVLACVSVFANGYGTRLEFNGGEVFYTSNASETDTKALGEYLAGDLGYFDGREKSVQLDKDNDKHIVRFCVQAGAEDNPEVETAFRAIQVLLKMQVFDKNPVEVQLCDEHFAPQKTLRAN